MKIALIGGAGFIGSQLTKAYLDAGHDVFVVDNLSYGTRESIDLRARFYQVDIRHEKLRTILQQEQPDLISHQAVQLQHDVTGERALADADVHIRGLLNILDSSVHAQVKKIIFASGGNSLYGQKRTEQLPVTEDMVLQPQCPLDISKVAGEWYIRYYSQRYGLKHSILRYADVYGEIDTIHPPSLQHPLNYFLYMLSEQNRPIIRGAGNEIRDHIFIDDVVQANLCILEHGTNETFNISSGQGNSLNHLYRMAAHCLNSQLEPVHLRNREGKSNLHMGALATNPTLLEYARAPIEYVPSEPVELLEEPATAIILDNTRAERVLGWRPQVMLSEGIERAAKYTLATKTGTPTVQRAEQTEEKKSLTDLGELTAV
ncbi:MAG TPA: NAD-dependent epimerase/dehydratase family protein [Ktedonosporobacter sp.]|nr:NAD-dependent epimerase/dehydratase family protein [Ktedonosporobacter sp.]